MSSLIMKKTGRGLMATLAIAALGSMLLPGVTLAGTAEEITSEILAGNAYTRENLKDMDGGISSKGSLQFWSSGGLIQRVTGDDAGGTYVSFALTPKHIEVAVLEEGKSAVAMYYSEGSFHENGSEPVAHYMTRITEVYVKEGGKWVVRAAHYSPIAAGSGTRQSSID
ncbi:MAG: hypothetical protein WBN31_12145 [Gammaproteobacteria bacterium]